MKYRRPEARNQPPATRRPKPRRAKPTPPPVEQAVHGGFIAVTGAPVEADPLSPGFIESVSQVDVVAVSDERALAPRALRSVRGYVRADLMAVAEIGYHYLFGGAPQIAHVVFDGLVAIDPDEAYFTLALGLTLDHLGDVRAAERCYTRAAKLDPSDGRPDVNRAELRIEQRDFEGATRLLRSGLRKAVAAHDERLAAKARAVIEHVGRGRQRHLRAVS